MFSLSTHTCITILAALDGVIQSWQGPFYPPDLETFKWLSYYSQVFDFVEINSSFYRIPNAFGKKNWSKKTPNQDLVDYHEKQHHRLMHRSCYRYVI